MMLAFLASLEDILSRFPALWVLVGGLFVGAIAFLIARKAFSLSAAAQDRLVKILEDSNEALTKERDDYRTRLHDTREKFQGTELKLQEALSRPDLTRLFESQQTEATRRYEVYTQQTELIARQAEVLAGVAEMQRQLVTNLAAYEKENGERHIVMMNCMNRILKAAKMPARKGGVKHSESTAP